MWGEQSTACDVEAVEQRGEGRTEKPVAQKIGREVHQYGGIDILKPYAVKEMYRIVGGEQQHGYAHDAP